MSDYTKPGRGRPDPATRGFLMAVCILTGLMLFAGILTRILPAGTYQRTVGTDGLARIVPGTYRTGSAPDYPLWRLLTAPVEVLASEDAAIAIVVGLFILVVGGAFAVLRSAGILEASVRQLARRFGRRRYRFLAVVCFCFMLIGSLMGVFEETVPLVPLAIALALSFGWDVFTGMAMSILAVGFGFSAAVANPFTVGTAQRLAGVAPLSGSLFRLLTFVVVYVVYMIFLLRYVRKLDRQRPPTLAEADAGEGSEAVLSRSNGVSGLDGRPESSGPSAPGSASSAAGDTLADSAGLRVFAWSGAFLAVLVLLMALTRVGSDYMLPLIALGCLVIALASGRAAGLPAKRLLGRFLGGALGVSPAILLILMALSVKLIIVSGGVMDTVLYRAAGLLTRAGPYQAVLAMFAITLGMNFFIGSASGKAFLLIPILAPLAELSGLSGQIAVQAFVFGDGFSNMLYPTNAVLLIVLGLSGMSWPQWFRRTWLLQLVMLVVSASFLLLAVALGYR